MIGKESIIGIGLDKDFEPHEFYDTARGVASVCTLEHYNPKACEELVTFFEGFARGMTEARALMAAAEGKKNR